jgi:hypothetical protein
LLSTEAFAQKPPFPRIGAIWFSYQTYEDPAVQRQLARSEVAVISFWPGWEDGRGTTIEQVIRNIKAINPRTKIFCYILNESIPADRRPTYAELYAKLDASRWYLYPSGLSGAAVPNSWPGNVTLNNTLFAPRDGAGDRWVEWYAKWAVQRLAAPNPSLDGFFLDNVFVQPRVDGDYNLDGSIDSKSNPTVGAWMRQGLREHFLVMNQIMPGKLQLGNVGEWGSPQATTTEYQGLLNGGFMEALIGQSYSVETWGGWDAMMAWYRKTMNVLGEPKLGIFHQIGDPNDYRSFRYGFTSSLMDDGYYAFNADDMYHDVLLFDEYNAQLGNATSAPPTSAWQKGVYRRDFANGIALVNPKGNGAQQVTLETDFRRLSGSQDSAVNNGQTVRTLTLQDRDGIVVMRTQAQSIQPGAAPPSAPQLTLVQ